MQSLYVKIYRLASADDYICVHVAEQVASDDSEEEGEMDFTEAMKNFKPGFM